MILALSITLAVLAVLALGILVYFKFFALVYDKDGMLMPLPEGVSKEEVDKAVKAGVIKLYDGMMTDDPKAWEERDGELWLEVGEGMSEDGWVKLSDDDGNLLFMTTRYVRAE